MGPWTSTMVIVQKAEVSGFSQSHYKRVYIKDFEISGYYDSKSDLSVFSCSITCSESSQCRSFSYRSSKDNDNNDNNDNVKDNAEDNDNINCYLYSTVAILTSTAIPKTGFEYYWKLSESCPASYHKNSQIKLCFKMFPTDPEKKTVLEAEKRCEQDGGHLIIIDTEERQTFLAVFLKQATIDRSGLCLLSYKQFLYILIYNFITVIFGNIVDRSDKTVKRSLVGGIELVADTEDWKWFNGAKLFVELKGRLVD
ncbi:hypothetical protein LOTGIDRAFT_174627 [Lottia gigantea]|uniref:C-type lectin domain-containing protein n=1 Tax=Lottia gigantea TaxID=225164 RepID=V4AJ53_LOTGI|nr:hypothetical protein LOTGIDRAFT_174627 [Lottia gigantea]ESO97102.1 hypothetical protein LOTGIDRAFT_174627 [Lottia gigantea]